jgi:uncharacterized OB-fold protein
MSVVRSAIEMGFPYTHSTGPVVGAALGALRAGRILGARCSTCAKVNVPAREWCELCGAPCAELVPVGPGATVSIAAAPWALVRLDGADTDLLHRISGGVTAGARVHPRWRAQRTGAITDVECFEPGEPEPAASPGDESAPVTMFERNVALPYELSAGELLSRFYDDIRERGVVHGVRCTSCGVVVVPPTVACARCWAPTDGWIALSDRGTVTTFVVVNVPFHGQQMPLPYVLARILLDGAGTSFLHVLGEIGHADVRMGMRVEAVWRAARTGFLNDDVEYFRPSGEPDVPSGDFLDRL